MRKLITLSILFPSICLCFLWSAKPFALDYSIHDGALMAKAVSKGQEVKKDGSSAVSQDFLSKVGGTLSEKTDLGQIASILNGLGDNLILESTRELKGIQVYQKASPFVVLILTDQGLGSGALIDAGGHVITNWHVVAGCSFATVFYKPKDSADLKTPLAFKAQVEKFDQTADLALLKILNPPKTDGFLGLGNLSNLQIGQDVHAIGHPSGQVWTYTKGIVSQIRPEYKWTSTDGLNHQANVIQTQTPINPGNSGGPLLDDDGKLIGLNAFRLQGDGLNYAVAVDSIEAFLSRKENRVASRNKPKQDLTCPESYDTQLKGQPDIWGCYISKASPPPDLWLVSTYLKDFPLCTAMGSKYRDKIDTIAVGRKDGGVVWFIDKDCTGIVSLIGKQAPGSGVIGSYQLPTELIRLESLAPALELAIRNKNIPYTNLQFCK